MGAVLGQEGSQKLPVEAEGDATSKANQPPYPGVHQPHGVQVAGEGAHTSVGGGGTAHLGRGGTTRLWDHVTTGWHCT